MTNSDAYDLRDFMPYLLNLAAETTSREFESYYKDRYGMLRTEWRVVFHLGRYGEMTAKEICTRARIHKTKVSRAVAALEKKRFLIRSQHDTDRRQEDLKLTPTGASAFEHLYAAARRFDADLMAQFSADERVVLRRCLSKIADL
ncbi:MarR family transcriptional regulator [Litoreibacter sp.]|nr:MarR family transcriptional regulator [Litoreibacter sp.]